MAKKKKGSKATDSPSAASSPSPAPSVASPVNIPTPSATTSASSNGSNTPTENVSVEKTLEDPAAIADELKEKGNVAFKASKFEEAIKLYSEAIGMSTRASLERH